MVLLLSILSLLLPLSLFINLLICDIYGYIRIVFFKYALQFLMYKNTTGCYIVRHNTLG